ncbi:MAG: dihydropteroate synthase [Microbacteriaceae bacterium]
MTPRQPTVIMGVLNVTPDSFSDGGRYDKPDAAIAHGLQLISQGAQIVDVGGESTRPGAVRVPADEEQRRVLPVIRELSAAGVTISIDTMNASTAVAAAAAGASYINDVSGGMVDPEMVPAVMDLDLPFVVMHWRGPSSTMDSLATYSDVAAEVRTELFERVDTLVTQGMNPDRLIIDPGLGFAKMSEHNWQVLSHLAEFTAAGIPVLVGASRKRFVGILPSTTDPVVVDALRPLQARDAATATISALASNVGIWGIRVHDVALTRIALDVASAWAAGWDPASGMMDS